MDKTIEIDDALVKVAQDLTGETGERAAVEKVLRGVLTQKQPVKSMFDLIGKVRIQGHSILALTCNKRNCHPGIYCRDPTHHGLKIRDLGAMDPGDKHRDDICGCCDSKNSIALGSHPN